MPASSVPIYLGCAGLIVGGLGLGAQHLLGEKLVPATSAQPEPPLFAQSVEEALLPTEGWPAQSPRVAFYEPTVELMMRAAAASAAAPSSAPTQSGQTGAVHEERTAAPREVVRDVPRQQTRQSSPRAKSRTKEAATTSVEPDPRDARAQADPGYLPRRSDRRSRERSEIEPVDPRSRYDRRQRGPDERRYRERAPRVIVEDIRGRDDIREPEPRYVRPPQPREGFSPLGILGGVFEPY
jgi:hypothetical protein